MNQAQTEGVQENQHQQSGAIASEPETASTPATEATPADAENTADQKSDAGSDASGE